MKSIEELSLPKGRKSAWRREGARDPGKVLSPSCDLIHTHRRCDNIGNRARLVLFAGSGWKFDNLREVGTLFVLIVLFFVSDYVESYKAQAQQFSTSAIALDFMEEGFSATDAARWANRGFLPGEAIAAIRHGHTDPDTAPDGCPSVCL